MTVALEAPGSFLEAFRTIIKKTKNKFIKVLCVEHGESVCATAALEDLWGGLLNYPEAFQKLPRSFPEAIPYQRAAGPRSA